ncbi:uncharacterized protein N7515_005698 [Penicillium bovifimosum]|uniref:Karyogamy protein n=1 Tax=Penicillium bovifimosum TaxID=126998 RepID=A0A9W9GT81_9EURO|nr:uncharacterized protein N7515_005698 [Penicillium bovifimosum]KAJ5129659.1 hypothetical protein N7515_005698 [Penicillium bovifimosum]
MHATVAGSPHATDLAAHSPNTSATPTSPPSLTPALSVSPNDSGASTLRRLKSKSSLRSLESNPEERTSPAESTSAGRTSFLRRLSPALAARVKLLDGSNKSATQTRTVTPVGRIPQEHLKELDSLHQDLSIKVKRKGQAWSATATSPQPPEFKRSASNQLELPRQDILQEIADARREIQESSEAVVDNPEPTGAFQTPEHKTPTTPMSVAQPVLAQPRAEPLASPLGSTGVQDNRTDFEKYVDDTAMKDAQSAPKPPPKDTPPADATHSRSSSNSQSYFNHMGPGRAESIYSFGRASFSSQLSQLTSIYLPQPASLEASIENISTALAAVRALNNAAEQIQIWIKKASDVLCGLDAEDDVEWAAAGGRDGLDEVDKAINRFESLVNVYVRAIENVQLRDDIGNVDGENLKTIVNQMESILENWSQIKDKLKGVKEQVELAMEWEELWSNVLGDVGVEVDSLSGLIFEMEEKRHQALMDTGDATGGLDINELETIVEESPVKGRAHAQNRLSLGPLLASASGTPVIKTPQDDTSHSNLMALFARMQPLRASLDFLPMRLSMFQARAENIFPTACEELEERRNRLEESYKVLETDAEALRKELGEDKWILVFRNAGAQAQKMFDSVERSIGKLQEGLECGMQMHNMPTLTKRMENYVAKKTHYVPAIDRVISIIQKGVNDRLTVNGEILRLLSDMTSRTDALKASIKFMDTSLQDIPFMNTQQLRDSVSSILTMDSPAPGLDTPGSSPANSVIMSGNKYKRVSTPMGSSRRDSSVGSATSRSAIPPSRRYSSLPQPVGTYTGRKSSIPQPTGLVSPTPSYRSSMLYTPTPATRTRTPAPPSTIPNRPRWTTSTNLNDMYNSTQRKSSAPQARTPRPSSTLSARDREMSSSPISGMRSTSRVSSRFGSRSPNHYLPSPTPARSSLLDPPPYSRLRRQSGIPSTPRSRQSFAGPPTAFSRSTTAAREAAVSPSRTERPGTALGHSLNRRTSLLPLPKRKEPATPKPVDTRPPWR